MLRFVNVSVSGAFESPARAVRRRAGCLLLSCWVVGCGADDDVVGEQQTGTGAEARGTSGASAEDRGTSGAGGAGNTGGDDSLIASDGDAGVSVSSVPAECARESFAAERVPVNLHLVVDVSGSMNAPISETSNRWDAVRDAISEFINSSDSAGLNLALSYYPAQEPRTTCSRHAQCGGPPCVTHVCASELILGIPVFCQPDGFDRDPTNCTVQLVDDNGDILLDALCVPSGLCSNAATQLCLFDEECGGGVCELDPAAGICPGAISCERGDYLRPAVVKQALPSAAMDFVSSLDATTPDGFALTPTHIALDGAYEHTAQWLVDEPASKSFVVLATDGFPTGCDTDANGIPITPAPELTLAELERGRQQGLSTFVIGVVDDTFGPVGEGRAALNEMAQAGGTDEALIVTADDTTADGFLAALDAIRGQVLPCEYKIPKPRTGVLDTDLLNIEIKDGGQAEIAPRVAQAGDCEAGEPGWHYAESPAGETPSTVVLCPQTCEQLNRTGNAQLDVVLGCKTVIRVK